jgi:hypothetical protein
LLLLREILDITRLEYDVEGGTKIFHDRKHLTLISSGSELKCFTFVFLRFHGPGIGLV